jgi:SAM-dependent methyltransferase
LLLLERVQITWLPHWGIDGPLGQALKGNPEVAWYFRHKAPEVAAWVDRIVSDASCQTTPADLRAAEVRVMNAMNDLLVYVVDPGVYDAQEFTTWDSVELTGIVDFEGKTVLDIGSGTGRLALVAALTARTVYAVEPVANLRQFIRAKARRLGLTNVYAADGLITDIPFPDGFADVAMGGHVFGDYLEEEWRELERVTRGGGQIVLCPGNNDRDDDCHKFLVSHGFKWSRFMEPGSEYVRKYWKTVSK